MKDMDMLARFESVEDMALSEEMLGAYVEGRLDAGESAVISDMICEDGYMEGIVEDVRVLPDIFSEEDHAAFDGVPSAEEIELPDFGEADPDDDSGYYLTEETGGEPGVWYMESAASGAYPQDTQPEEGEGYSSYADDDDYPDGYGSGVGYGYDDGSESGQDMGDDSFDVQTFE